MSESWDAIHCTHCGKKNFICMGDTQDMTSSMGEGFVCLCWSCKKKFWRERYEDFKIEFECYGYDPAKSEEENLNEMQYAEGEEKAS